MYQKSSITGCRCSRGVTAKENACQLSVVARQIKLPSIRNVMIVYLVQINKSVSQIDKIINHKLKIVLLVLFYFINNL